MIYNKNCKIKFNEKLKERFFNTSKFSNNDNNKFVLLLWKGVYRYEYVDDWEKYNETSLPEKDDIYSDVNMKVILMQITFKQEEFVNTLK